MYVSLASALPRYVKALKGWSAQCNLRLRCPFSPKRAADHHMKPPNGSMSKEAESPWTRHHIVIKALGSQGLLDKFSLITTSSCRAGTSSAVAR